MRRRLVAGNWKMNGLRATLDTVDALVMAHPAPMGDIVICPPATLLTAAVERAAGSALWIGAQDCHAAPHGAHTGDIAAPMIADAGAAAVIVGHSERREQHGESSDMVRAKARAAHDAGLSAIICLGETLAEREAGRALDVIASQLAASVPEGCVGANTVIAYEPVWAIGTGLTPATAQIAEVQDFIREGLARRFGDAVADAVRLLYGGSVKPGNAAEIFGIANVDGALVGGASLDSEVFSQIISIMEDDAKAEAP